MKFELRFATSDDAETIHRFISELAEYERDPKAVEVTPEILRRQMMSKRPPFECLVVEEIGASPIGFALFFHNYSTWKGQSGLYIEDIFVSPEYRGNGIGQALIRELASIARDRNCGRMEWAVLDWNEPAIDFYKRHGAKPLEDWTIYRLTGKALEGL
ncbi:MAG: GNAT family N-acetyltransferase [Deltaproteobacteria bacterium]|nr:GNAT family N-acetyltransferase [Deltaproteobacteria bacterium]